MVNNPTGFSMHQQVGEPATAPQSNAVPQPAHTLFFASCSRVMVLSVNPGNRI